MSFGFKETILEGRHLLYQTIASLWCLWKISPVWKCTPRICFVFHIQIAELNFIRFIWIWQTICHRANGLQLEVYFVSIKTGRHWVVWLLFSKTCVDCCKSNRLIRLQQAGAVRQKLTGSDNLSQSVWQGAPSGLTRTRSTTGTEGMPKLWWNVINWMISISNSKDYSCAKQSRLSIQSNPRRSCLHVLALMQFQI